MPEPDINDVVSHPRTTSRPWDEAAFESWYRAWVRDVLRYAQRRTTGEDVAWDVVGETFTVAWRRSADAPATDDEMLPWLYAIAANVIRNVQRADRRREAVTQRALHLRDSCADGQDEADARLDARREFPRALAQLRADDRELVMLVAWERLDLRGAASALGISYGAAKVRLHRARRRLRESLPATAAPTGDQPDPSGDCPVPPGLPGI